MDMEHSKTHQQRVTHIHENDYETASYAYLMSLAIVLLGLPLPIINLIAAIAFWYANRKSSDFVKWHCSQALLGQIPLFITNTILLWWTVKILLDKSSFSSLYFAYFITIALFNLIEFIEFIRTAIKVRKRTDYRWFALAPLADYMIGRRPLLPSFFREAGVFLGILSVSIVGLSQFNWGRILYPVIEKVKIEASNEIKSIFIMNKEVISTPEIIHPIDSLFNKLCLSNNIDASKFQLYVIHDEEANAFCLPGKHIVIHSNLIKSCESPSELMAVLAHELAHSELRHNKLKWLHSIALIAMHTILGYSDTSKTAASLLTTAIQNTYSQSLESESDITAVTYMKNADWDPLSLATILEKIAIDEPGKNHLKWLRSHPYTEDRVDTIKQEIERIGIDSTQIQPPLSTERWKNVISAVKNL